MNKIMALGITTALMATGIAFAAPDNVTTKPQFLAEYLKINDKPVSAQAETIREGSYLTAKADYRGYLRLTVYSENPSLPNTVAGVINELGSKYSIDLSIKKKNEANWLKIVTPTAFDQFLEKIENKDPTAPERYSYKTSSEIEPEAGKYTAPVLILSPQLADEALRTDGNNMAAFYRRDIIITVDLANLDVVDDTKGKAKYVAQAGDNVRLIINQIDPADDSRAIPETTIYISLENYGHFLQIVPAGFYGGDVRGDRFDGHNFNLTAKAPGFCLNLYVLKKGPKRDKDTRTNWLPGIALTETSFFSKNTGGPTVSNGADHVEMPLAFSAGICWSPPIGKLRTIFNFTAVAYDMQLSHILVGFTLSPSFSWDTLRAQAGPTEFDFSN